MATLFSFFRLFAALALLCPACPSNRHKVFYSFKISTSNDYYMSELPKSKHGDKDLGEDSCIVSPYSIAVSDGVGASELSPKYLSAIITAGFTHWMHHRFQLKGKMQFNAAADFQFDVSEALDKQCEIMRKNIELLYEEWEKKRGRKSQYPLSEMHIGATSANVLIHPAYEDHEAFIRVYIRGDSQVILFRPRLNGHTDSKAEAYYMFPYMVTPAKQREFNVPSSFRTDNSEQPESENFMYSDTVREGHLVIVGSDGVFDNIHPGFLFLTVSLIYWNRFKTEAEIQAFEARLAEIVKIYLCVMETRHEDLQHELYHRTPQYHLGKTIIMPDIRYASLGKIECLKGAAADTHEDRVALFQSRLRALEAQGKTKPDEDALVLDFFNCPIDDVINRKGYDNNGKGSPSMPTCIEDAVRKHLKLEMEEIVRFSNAFPSKTLSGIIGRLALQFSKAERYPSQFYLNAWVAERHEGVIAGGKPDDITVVFAPVIKSTTPFGIDEQYKQRVQDDRTWVNENLPRYFFQVMDAMNAQLI